MTDTSPAAVQRYNAYNRSGDIASMENVVNGQYVHYSDYAALSSKLDAANQRHAALSSKLDAANQRHAAALDAVARANDERDALVAAAYEAAADHGDCRCAPDKSDCIMESGSVHLCYRDGRADFSKLNPAHATAALDRIKAEVRDAAALEAVERVRDAALVEAASVFANAAFHTGKLGNGWVRSALDQIAARRSQAHEPRAFKEAKP